MGTHVVLAKYGNDISGCLCTIPFVSTMLWEVRDSVVGMDVRCDYRCQGAYAGCLLDRSSLDHRVSGDVRDHIKVGIASLSN